MILAGKMLVNKANPERREARKAEGRGIILFQEYRLGDTLLGAVKRPDSSVK